MSPAKATTTRATAKRTPKLRVVAERRFGVVLKAVAKGLVAYNAEKAGKSHYKRFAVSIRDRNDEIRGGIVAYTIWNWCFIEWLWLDETARGSGLGTELMAEAEAIARKRGAEHVYLDTFSFQGDGFYQKLGYEVFGELDNFPPGHRRLWLKKDLT